jgi:ankyrin repeat protein
MNISVSSCYISRLAIVLLIALACSMPACKSSSSGSPIYDAARDGKLPKLKSLLRDNPDLVYSKDKYGFTPLHWAAQNGHKDAVELLLAGKAEANAGDRVGRTPLHWTADCDIAKLLLANKADVNAKCIGGWTPLHMAASKDQKDLVELLLANGAEVNARDDAGSTPLRAASLRGGKKAVELLRQHGGQE